MDLIGTPDLNATVVKIGNRIDLLAEMATAGTVAGLMGFGAALVSKGGWTIAVGTGAIVAASAMFSTFRASPHSNGLVIAVTKQTVDDQFTNQNSTVERTIPK